MKLGPATIYTVMLVGSSTDESRDWTVPSAGILETIHIGASGTVAAGTVSVNPLVQLWITRGTQAFDIQNRPNNPVVNILGGMVMNMSIDASFQEFSLVDSKVLWPNVLLSPAEVIRARITSTNALATYVVVQYGFRPAL